MSEPTVAAPAHDLDAVLDRGESSLAVAEDLFGVVDLLDSQSGLRRAVTDPATELAARRGLVDRLLGERIGEAAKAVVDAALTIRWSSPSAMTRALERQGVRAVLRDARCHDDLDEVTDELFRFRQTVLANPRLAVSLGDQDRAVEDRRRLVSTLVEGKVRPHTLVLSRRAVGAAQRTFEATMEHYLDLAAQMRGRAVAVVTTATGLTEDQRSRMAAQLERITGHPVDLQEVVDPDVLGGARVDLGDEVIDGTVASRLDQARRELG